ncbi:baeRF11 domain-containing protein [Phenylobacterium koreense]|uniref:Peptide chain release factor 1 n=1 Tax=Phenylobacterium koreense TaxID=266125 RepID=A0ABV2EJE8_9CAUL
MLYVDIPTAAEFKALNEARADACVSIYLRTTPLAQSPDATRIELGNLIRQAREQLQGSGFDKRRLALLTEHLDDLLDDDEFWRLQASSLAILATPDSVRTFRLPNNLSSMAIVSDRFHLKPLLRSITFPHSAFVLAISENAVRLVGVYADLPPTTIKVPGFPKHAADAVGKGSLNDRSPSGRVHGLEGQNVRFRQYARQVDAALRPVLTGRDTPLILAGVGRVPSIFRSVNSYPGLVDQTIEASPDHMTEAQLAEAARPILDGAYQQELSRLRALYEARASEGRATSDLSDAARAATGGAIEVLLVNIDTVVPGAVDETGAVTFSDKDAPAGYGVADEIAARALASGARVLGVREPDLPAGGELAAILRYPV